MRVKGKYHLIITMKIVLTSGTQKTLWAPRCTETRSELMSRHGCMRLAPYLTQGPEGYLGPRVSFLAIAVHLLATAVDNGLLGACIKKQTGFLVDWWLGLCASTTGSTAESMAGNKDPTTLRALQPERDKKIAVMMILESCKEICPTSPIFSLDQKSHKCSGVSLGQFPTLTLCLRKRLKQCLP